MAIIDEAKTWVRVSTNDSAIVDEINTLVDAAIDDLTNTADIATVDRENLPPLVKLAVRSYVQAYWTRNVDEQAKYLGIYDGLKAKLATSSVYNTRN